MFEKITVKVRGSFRREKETFYKWQCVKPWAGIWTCFILKVPITYVYWKCSFFIIGILLNTNAIREKVDEK